MRPLITIVGYFFILIGFISLILSLMGLGLFPLTYIDRMASGLTALLVKMGFIVIGFVLFYVGRTMQFEEEEG